MRTLAGGRADVLCVDNYFTGRKDNIAHLLANPHFEAMRHDVTFPLYVEVDQIYNLACPASPVHYQFDPVQTTKTSVIGAINMLGLAKRIGAKILQASTSEVYGDPEIHPQTEDYRGNVNPLGPRACYDEGKRCAETLFFDYHRQHRTQIKVVRIFNTYGPRMHPNDGRVVSNFIVQALQNQDITLYGDGSQTRAFCFVDDLIDGFIRLMATGPEITGPINIGNPHEIPVRELAERVIRITGSTSRIVHRPLPQDDPLQRCPDITMAKSVLGWHPTVELDDGLRKTAAYFQQMLAGFRSAFLAGARTIGMQTSTMAGLQATASMAPGDCRSAPKVAIVILNWNDPAATMACLAALAEPTYPNCTSIVIDNGSKTVLEHFAIRASRGCRYKSNEPRLHGRGQHRHRPSTGLRSGLHLAVEQRCQCPAGHVVAACRRGGIGPAHRPRQPGVSRSEPAGDGGILSWPFRS